jgi:hypothetical protein
VRSGVVVFTTPRRFEMRCTWVSTEIARLPNRVDQDDGGDLDPVARGRHARERPDTDVVLIEPYAHDLQLFDYHLMTYSLRHEVIRRGYRTTIKTFLADYDRHAALFARHGIRLKPQEDVEQQAREWSRRPKASSRGGIGDERAAG